MFERVVFIDSTWCQAKEIIKVSSYKTLMCSDALHRESKSRDFPTNMNSKVIGCNLLYLFRNFRSEGDHITHTQRLCKHVHPVHTNTLMHTVHTYTIFTQLNKQANPKTKQTYYNTSSDHLNSFTKWNCSDTNGRDFPPSDRPKMIFCAVNY